MFNRRTNETVEKPIYEDVLPTYGDLISRENWLEAVNNGNFIDYDGHGCPVKDGKMASYVLIIPSQAATLDPEATHVMWFNR
jgi:hypothetical protein